MFRISAHDTDTEILLTFEGRLTGPWAAEADASWQASAAGGSGRTVAVDLCGVTAVDAAGRELLVRMHRAGVRFVVRGCLMRELVREIADEIATAVSRR